MKIKTTLEKTVTFSIEAYWNEEGGMGERVFVNGISSIEEAVVALDKANYIQNDMDWIIVGRVTEVIR